MNTQTSTSFKPLRLWPGVLIAIVMLLVRLVAPLVSPDSALIVVLGPAAGGLLIALWWLLFSRARWIERIGVFALLIAAGYVTLFIVHPSIRGGLMGRMVPIMIALPGLALALVVWAAAAGRLASPARYAALIAIVAVTCGLFAIIRTDGLFGGIPRLTWRWTPTAEERLLARTADEPLPIAPSTTPPAIAPSAPAASGADAATPSGSTTSSPIDKTPPAPAAPPAIGERKVMRIEWPGFRGLGRNGVIRGVQIQTDWTATPPTEIWRRPIGPGWSSFAVADDLLFTQEQRGGDEMVAAYRASTGKPVWMHKDPVRFYESNGGAGPRSTPALSDGRVYAMGATGILNVLDAATGARVWKRETVSDAGIQLPGWGITSSPLVVDDLVVVAVSGALLAYDRASGEKRWFVKSTGGSYSSPHLVTVGGVPQILLLAGAGVTSVAPADGTVLWRNAFAGTPIVQPAVIGDGDILFSASDAMGGLGTRRLAVARGPDGWKVEERWTSNGLKPFFNDYVVHEGHAYGFDGNILACIDLADGKRKWKGGRYGNGQVVLLADQDLLLVVSEEGELALVSATPDQFTEVAARVPAIEGKTWNHPVIVGEMLFLRNGQEMAAFRLPRARRSTE